MKKISIIIPAHNEERNIPLIYDKLKEVSESFLGKYLFEIIFINDGSDDDTFVEIEKLARNDENLKYIDFSRNFGKETATSAGLNSCNGDACIMLDAELPNGRLVLKLLLELELKTRVMDLPKKSVQLFFIR